MKYVRNGWVKQKALQQIFITTVHYFTGASKLLQEFDSKVAHLLDSLQCLTSGGAPVLHSFLAFSFLSFDEGRLSFMVLTTHLPEWSNHNIPTGFETSVQTCVKLVFMTAIIKNIMKESPIKYLFMALLIC